MENSPPRLALALLRWFCNPIFLPDIEGDLLQLYTRRVSTEGKKKANYLFYKDVFLLFRPGIIRSFIFTNYPNIMEILKHNLKISLRNHLKYRSFFLINLLGLTSGLACVIFIYLWVNDEVAMDQYHSKKDRLYQIMENVHQEVCQKSPHTILNLDFLKHINNQGGIEKCDIYISKIGGGKKRGILGVA